MKIENLCINCMREMKEPGGICEFCGFNVETFELPRHHMRPFTILAGKYLIGKAIGDGDTINSQKTTPHHRTNSPVYLSTHHFTL